MLIYLSGSIEFADGYGKAWRAELTPFLEGLGHRVYDPAADELKNLDDDEAANFRSWKTSDPERFVAAVRKIVHWDLDIVEKQADAVICYWDEHAGKGAGTQAEVTAAFRAGKPVYLVTPLARERISGWVLACVTRVFGSFGELRSFLDHGIERKNEPKGTEKLLHGELSGQVLKCAIQVHRTLGAGFLEKVYVRATALELRRNGIAFEMEKHLKVFYDGVGVGDYIADMDVEQKIIIEFKACEGIVAEHEAQLLNYLHATRRRLGLLLNFGRPTLEIKRKIV